MLFVLAFFPLLFLVLWLSIGKERGDPVLSRTLNGNVTFHIFEQTQDFGNSTLVCSSFDDDTTLARISNSEEFHFVESMVSEVLDSKLIANPVNTQEHDIRLWIGRQFFMILFLHELFACRS